MKHYLYFTFAFISILFTFSCSKDDDDRDMDAWKAANEQAFNAIKSNPEYRELKSPGNEGSIYYKVLTEGAGTTPIYYTDTVAIYVKGYYAVGNDKLGIKKNDVFQKKEFDDGIPVYIPVSAPSYLPNGIRVSLQNMKKGDKWEIWIPYQLGFGSAGVSVSYDFYNTDTQVSVPAWSTITYDIEIVDIL